MLCNEAVNDALGRDAGDDLLRMIGRDLARHYTAPAAPGSAAARAAVGRVSADVFAVVLTDAPGSSPGSPDQPAGSSCTYPSTGPGSTPGTPCSPPAPDHHAQRRPDHRPHGHDRSTPWNSRTDRRNTHAPTRSHVPHRKFRTYLTAMSEVLDSVYIRRKRVRVCEPSSGVILHRANLCQVGDARAAEHVDH